MNINKARNKGSCKHQGHGKNEEKDSMSTLQGLHKLLGNIAFTGRTDEPEPNADRQGIKKSPCWRYKENA